MRSFMLWLTSLALGVSVALSYAGIKAIQTVLGCLWVELLIQDSIDYYRRGDDHEG